MLSSSTALGQWPKCLLILQRGHCKIHTSRSDYFIRTLTKEKYPGNFVGNREYSTTEVITILGDWEIFGKIEEIQDCHVCEHNM